jgi:hypothetical protein
VLFKLCLEVSTMLSFMPTFRHLDTTTNQRSEQASLPVSFPLMSSGVRQETGESSTTTQISVKIVLGPLVVNRFLTKFRFLKISRNWLRNDFRVSRKWGTSFASFAVSRNCRDYERNEFCETWKSQKQRKLKVKIQNLTNYLLILVKMPAKVVFGIAGHH